MEAANTTGVEDVPVISKSELKRRAKAAKKAEAKAAKQADLAARGIETGTGKSKKDTEVEKDPRMYFANRVADLQAVPEFNPYPHKFNATQSIPNAVVKYQYLDAGVQLRDVHISIAGRIMSARSNSTKLVFYDVQADGSQIQVIANRREASDESSFDQVHGIVKRGDLIGVEGFMGRSKNGELSVFACNVILLAPCLRMMPSQYFGLKNQESRFRQRYLDLIVNPRARETFRVRAQVVGFIRRFLDARGFLEVETPMMNMIHGGAAAKPFVTRHNDLDMQLYMRVAPELHLKELIVGGLDRVYEIGRNFRNEGIDMTHNPEFTSCEFYWAYADYNDLMEVTEKMVSDMVLEICGSYKINYKVEQGKEVEIDFTPPFKRIPLVKGVEDAGGFTIPRPLDGPEAFSFLRTKCQELMLNISDAQTSSKLLDKLVGHYLEDDIIHPTFLIDHPVIMSPLAKWHRNEPELTERFELFSCGRELCNAYTELNDPAVQRERFMEQLKGKAQGDDEAHEFNEDFCVALEYGLPPTAGWGMGIDRLTMFLANHDTIKEVLLFPAMKPVDKSVEESDN